MLYILSAVSPLMILGSLKPIDLWWLSFVALVPYAYILFKKDKFSLRQSIIAGSLVSVILSAGMSFPTLTQFHWYEMATVLVIIVQLLWAPIIVLGLLLGALQSYIFRKLSDDSKFDILLFAAIWTIFELIRNLIFFNLDLGFIGYAMHSVPIMMELASIGGVFMVSFILALINGFLAYEISFRKPLNFSCWHQYFIFSIAILVMFFINHAYLNYGNSLIKVIAVSTIQVNIKEKPFGKFDSDKNFILEEKTQNMIRAAAMQGPDYLIYPFNIVGGIFTDGSEYIGSKELLSGTFDDFGKWLATFVPEKTNFVMWTNTHREGNRLSAEVNFWENGSINGFYLKRELFPFLDFTPSFLQRFNIYTTPLDYESGPPDQVLNVGGVNIGNLICSELNSARLAGSDSFKSDIIFAIGSAAVFRDNIMGDRNLVLAQFRAAENNLPVVRSDRKGPSAIIDSRGSILKELPFGKDGIIKYDIPIKSHRPTIYAIFGDWLILGIIFLIFTYRIFGKNFPVRLR